VTNRPISASFLDDRAELLDVAGTIGVVSMAARILPAIEAVAIAHGAGPVAFARRVPGYREAQSRGERRADGPHIIPDRNGQPLRWSCLLTGRQAQAQQEKLAVFGVS
jgi:hypothetical protein